MHGRPTNKKYRKTQRHTTRNAVTFYLARKIQK